DAKVRGARGSDASRGVTDCTGPGGGGGSGVVWMKGAVFSPNLIADITGGSNGVISAFSSAPCIGLANGATSGGNGSAISDYVAPAFGSFLCAPLPVPELKFFRARAEEKAISLGWTMVSIDNIRGYEVQRSIDQVNYSTIAHLRNDGNYTFSINDLDKLGGTFFYRLKLIRTNATVGYSTIIAITKNQQAAFDQLSIFPNPAIHQIKVSAIAKKSTVTKLNIFNASGQRVYHYEYRISAGYILLTVPVDQLSAGVYWLMLEADGLRERKKFIRAN
ncbi:MAG: T9SS type A sorting domain-containing protein, partial [Chitinophagaceae bacterium]|nr:T9SS type A sorting domain-containing protein [Chitinophagaceae bacterium]